MLRLAVCACMLAAFLAGCSSGGDAPPEADAPAPDTPEPTEPLRKDATFGWAAGLGEPVLGMGPQVMSTNAASLDVPEAAGILRVYANWTCATLSCDLHLYVYAPGEGPGNGPAQAAQSSGHGMGASPLALEVQVDAAGEWTAALFPGSPDATVDGTIALVFDAPAAESAAGADAGA